MMKHGHHDNHESADYNKMSKNASLHDRHSQETKYNVINLRSDPATPESSKPTKLTIAITEQRTGNAVTKFDIVHDKLMHLVIVSDDLAYFAHVHPQFKEEDGIFTIIHVFPEAGKYKMWVDVKPKDKPQLLQAFLLSLAGQPAHKLIPITPDKSLVKNVTAAAGGRNYQVRLKVPERVVAREKTDIVFELVDSEGKPVRDLEPLMAAGGHCVIISADATEFLHVHPVEEVANPQWRGGPKVAFQTNFPASSLYKVWGQFQHKASVITADFVLEVK